MAPEPDSVGAALAGACVVEVVALDADDKMYIKSYSVPMAHSLQGLEKEWAKLFNIPSGIVGFEDAKGCLLDLHSTPTELGWGGSISLQAVPLEDRWADPRQRTQCAPLEEQRADLQRTDPIAEEVVPLNDQVADAQQMENTAEVLERSEDNENGASNVDVAPQIGIKRPLTSDVPRVVNHDSNAADSNSVVSEQNNPERPSMPAPRASNREACPARHDPVVSELNNPERRPTPAAKASRCDTCPVRNEPITFEQSNPKRQNTQAYMRYEQYKAAKTPQEAVTLGADRGDLVSDFKRGFLHRL